MRYAHKTVSAMALTAAAPSAATDGIDASDAEAVSVCVSAAANVTIQGGNMDAYVYRPVSVNADGSVATWRWMRHKGLDFAPDTGVRDSSAGGMEVPCGIGRVAWAANGLVLSTASPTVDVTISLRRTLS